MSPSGTGARQLGEQRVDAGGEDGSAAVDPDDGDRLARVALDNLVSDAPERALDVLGTEDDLLVVVHVVPSWPLGTGLKGDCSGYGTNALRRRARVVPF